MKNFLAITLIAFLAACSSTVDKPGTPDEIKEQISAYKEQIGELNKKITLLEDQLIPLEGTRSSKVPVGIQTIVAQPFHHYVEVNGSVEAINEAFISPEINGQVTDIYVKEGDQVSKGQMLIKINSSIAESSLTEITTALELANTVYEKQKGLWDKKIGSEIDYLQAKNNKEALESKLKTLQAQIDMGTIKSPIDGVVDNILVKKGELAIPGLQVVRILNLNNLYINADVSEAYLTKVKKGDPVLVEFPSYPEISMEVPVYRTGNMVKEANRTFLVQIKVENENKIIKPNVLAKIKINDYSDLQAVVIPSIIIKQDLKGSYVYIADKNSGLAMKSYIETGMTYNGMSEVTKGLNAGDTVIVEGYNQISDGTAIEIVK